MAEGLMISITYDGRDAKRNMIDMYDAGVALIGLQRSLALTTHLILNGEIITQAPSLKGARILSVPPQDGSWKATVLIVGALYSFGSTNKDSPIGNIIYSAYDYVIKETLGFHVDYAKTLGEQYEAYKTAHPKPQIKTLLESRFHSLSEKCEPAIRDMHRPISYSRTADTAMIAGGSDETKRQLGVNFDMETAEYIYSNLRSEQPEEYVGEVTGYYSDTYKGRIYVPAENRRLSFVLDKQCRDAKSLLAVTNSLTANAQNSAQYHAYLRVTFKAFTYRTTSGRLKGFHIVSISSTATARS